MPDLVTRLTVDRKGLAQGLTDAEKDLKAFAKDAAQQDMTTSVGEGFGMVNMDKWKKHQTELRGSAVAFWGALTAITAAGMAGLRQAMAFGGETQDMADRTGLSPETVQRLSAAGGAVGVSMEQIAGGLKKLTLSQVEALSGNKETVAQFATLGVSLDDLRNKDAAGVFAQISAGLNGAAPNAEQFAAILKVLGKSADELIPLLRQGMDGFKFVVPDNAIAALDGLGDQFDHLKRTGTALAYTLAGAFVGLGTDVAAAVGEFTGLKSVLEDIGLVSKEADITKVAGADSRAAAIVKGITDAKAADAEAAKKQTDEEAKTKAKIADLDARTAEETRKQTLAAMSPEDRKKALEAERAELNKIAGDYNRPELERKQALLQATLLGGQIAGIKTGPGSPESAIVPIPRASQMDSLASIGGLTQFGGFSEEVGLMREIRDFSRESADALSRLEREGIL